MKLKELLEKMTDKDNRFIVWFIGILTLLVSCFAFYINKTKIGDWTLFILDDNSVVLSAWKMFVNVSYAVFFGAMIIFLVGGLHKGMNKPNNRAVRVGDTIIINNKPRKVIAVNSNTVTFEKQKD